MSSIACQEASVLLTPRSEEVEAHRRIQDVCDMQSCRSVLLGGCAEVWRLLRSGPSHGFGVYDFGGQDAPGLVRLEDAAGKGEICRDYVSLAHGWLDQRRQEIH